MTQKPPQIVDFQLSPELLKFQAEARQFAATHLANSAEWDLSGKFPAAAIAAAGKAGFLRVTVAKEHGGSALGNVASCIMLEEINARCPATGVTISVHNSLVNALMNKWADDGQRRRYLPKLLTGEWIGAYCLSEAASGSDAAGLRCEAKKVGDHWLLNGPKLWVTSGNEAGLFVVFARTGPDRVKGISAFLVERTWPGVSIGKKERKVGLRASSTTELVLDNVKVPADCLVDKEGNGFPIALDLLDGGRLGIASQSLGLARTAKDLIQQCLAAQQDDKGRPTATQPDQWTLADIAAELDAFRLLTWRAAILRDAGTRCSMESAMAKNCAARLANRAARAAVSILGQAGASGVTAAERLLRDARITEIYEGATDIQRLVTARALLAPA